MDARVLIETLQDRGLSISLVKDRVRVKSPQEPDRDTKALLQELREQKEEVKSILAENPTQELPPACWDCGEITTETKDIYGETVWACWSCAKSA